MQAKQIMAPVAARVQSVDALRGFVMIVMALDHVRDFFHTAAQQYSAEDLTRASAALFLTRIVTHICAPVFMFTAGLGAYFWRQSRGRSTGQLSRFLWSRGLWLVVLELTLFHWIMFLSFTNGPVLLVVLWALGWSMVSLGFLVWLPVPWLAALSGAVIALHNLTDGVKGGWFWNVLHRQGAFPVDGTLVIVAYPLIPWLAVMALGYCFGRVMTLAPEVRQRWMVRIGLGMLAAFLALRGLNMYGDPAHWTPAHWLSFLRVTKNPPSLEYLLLTLGPAMLLLAWFDRVRWAAANPLMVFGRVPMFYFLTHLLAAHLLLFPFAWWKYGRVDFLWQPLPALGGPAGVYPAGFGISLIGTYVVWALVVVLLYPLCRWFMGVKERARGSWWVGYV